jgi:FAD/FMN-containing dehydrogenase
VTGNAVCDDGLVIDLSPMKGIWVDPRARAVRVQGGATWTEVNHELQVFGLAAAGGYIGTTGVAGLTLGGGLGWLVRKHGLALDNLISAEVVTADGQVLTASEAENQELFWGLRGGGGNFGVVTSFEFRVHPVGTVLAGMVLHPLGSGHDALRHWRDFTAGAREECTSSAVLLTAPAAPFVPPEAHGAPVVALSAVCIGATDAAVETLRPIREFAPPAADLFQSMPFIAAQTLVDDLMPKGLLNYWKSNFIGEFTDEALDVVLSRFARVPSPRTLVFLEHNGGALNRVPPDATAFGHREYAYNVVITSMWDDPADTEANIAWTTSLWEALQPFTSDDVYVNYLGSEGEQRVRAAYKPATYKRLVALKDKHDPDNFFRLNQNIRPGRSQDAAHH